EHWIEPYFIYEVQGKNCKLRNMDERLVKDATFPRFKIQEENSKMVTLYDLISLDI
ncbi:5921_t:CDS:2, partial [Funneliformis caledonium]